MGADPGDRPIFDDGALGCRVGKIHRIGGNPRKAVARRPNPEPTVVGLHVNIEFLTMAERVGPVIIPRGTAASVGFPLSNEDDIGVGRRVRGIAAVRFRRPRVGDAERLGERPNGKQRDGPGEHGETRYDVA